MMPAREQPKKWRLFLLAFFCLSVLAVPAQSPFLDSLQQQLTSYRRAVVQEKVFLHTDKTFYLAGETLWFKAYVLNADTHQPMDLSKVLYTELLDEKNKPVMQAMIDLRQGLGDGYFLLPPSLNAGMYRLRAYTAWMKNFDEAFYFQTPIQVVNSTRRPDWILLEKKRETVIRFFPEGGNLVEGLKTKLAFQLTDEYGKGVAGDGYIIANEKDTVVHFHPLKFGIGSVDFAPQKGTAYKAFVRVPRGEVIAAKFPPVYQQGYVLQLADAGKDQLRLTATTNIRFGHTVYLLAHTRGEVRLAAAKITGPEGKAEWTIDKEKMGEGITSFTLFDAARKPVCERLYFKRPTQKMTIDLRSDAAVYGSRSKVQLNISTQNEKGQAVDGELSLSVFLLDSLQGLPQNAINEYLWLASELKGTIEAPGYYLANDNAEVNEALDNLLLTHGWRRFVWEDFAQKQALPFLPDYEGPVIRGRVVDKQSGSPVPHVLCYLSVPGEKFFSTNALSNERGEVSFVTKNIYGPVEVVTQTDRPGGSLRVDLLNGYSEKMPEQTLPRFVLPEKWKERLAKRHLDLQLENAFATAAMRQFYLPQQSDSTRFYGKPDRRYRLDDYTRFPSMEEVMREIVAEVWVNKENDSFHYRVNNLPYREHFNADPLVLFDGVPVFTTNRIISYDPLKIKAIDVVARRFFWGNTVANGIVSYTTYDGNLADFEPDPGVVLMEYNGLQVKREFYSPVYATPAQLQNREPDKRNVLLWDPSLSSTAQEVQFYTSDVPGKYAIQVQGVDREGRPGNRVLVIEVK